ncbi:hypothetical protein K2Y00_00945 [Patescibacteria group bacterium]|nr:hypothetical protein [Patescibacteria group bacterium]
MRYLLLSLLFVLPLHAHAALPLYAEVRPVTGGGTEVAVYLSATQNAVNAVEGTLVLPENSSVSFSTGGSVVSYWVEQPALNGSSVRFSGLIPGGFTGVLGAPERSSDGFLFSVRVKEDSSTVRLIDAGVFLNDGEGTRLAVVDSTYESGAATVAQVTDTTPPLWFDIERIRDVTVADGKPVLIMTAIDKESGIARFAVAEGFMGWKEVESPYVLEGNTYITLVRARAYDHEGNYKEQLLLPKMTLPLLVLLALILIGVLMRHVYKRYRS